MDSLVLLAFILTGILEIAIPLILGFLAVKKLNVSWKVFGFGSLFFVLVQIIHVPLVIFTQPVLSGFLAANYGKIAIVFVLAVYLGLLAGLFEEITRWLVLKYFFARQKIKLNKNNALMFGLGWAGIESALVGILVLLSMLSYVSITSMDETQIQDVYGSQLNETQMSQLKEQRNALLNLNPFDVLIGLLERIMTIGVHLAFTFLVFTGIVSGRKIYLVLAVFFHSLLDFLAVYVSSLYGILPTEGIALVFALASLYYVRKQFK